MADKSEPAFPAEISDGTTVMGADGKPQAITTVYPGMTLLDYFAAAAMTGLVSQDREGGTYHEAHAMMAYAIARAMLKERAK